MEPLLCTGTLAGKHKFLGIAWEAMVRKLPAGPVPPDYNGENPPPIIAGYLEKIGMQMKQIRVALYPPKE